MLFWDCHIDVDNVQRGEFVYFYGVLRFIIIIISSRRINNTQATTEVSMSKTRGTYVSFTQMVHSYKGARSVPEDISHKISKRI